MSIGTILEVGIGLIFVFLLLGLIVSALQEAIAALLGLRSKYLMEGLSTILADVPGACWLARSHYFGSNLDQGSALFKEVAGHALVSGITPSKIPSYVAAGNFASALIDVLRKGGTGTLATDLQSKIAAMPDGPVRQALSTLLTDAKGDADVFRKNVEVWFDGAMERVSGRYKRWTQYFAIIAGIAIAVAINANTIMIAERLWNDPTLRAAAVEAAQAYVDHCTANPDAGDCPKTVPPPAPEAQAQPQPPQQQPEQQPNEQAQQEGQPENNAAREAEVKEAQAKYENLKAVYAEANQKLTTIGYPIGWTELPKDLIGWLTSILGWLITGLAVSLGAPFWFDMLKTFVNVRGAGQKPAETKPGS